MFRVLFFELIQRHTSRGTQTDCKGCMHIAAEPILSMVGGAEEILVYCDIDDYEIITAAMASYACKLANSEEPMLRVDSISTGIDYWEVRLSTDERGGEKFSWVFLIPSEKRGSTVLMQDFLLAQPPMEVDDD